jgi:hypothetical protein
MTERNAIILILTALGIREAWTLLPNVTYTFDPFPFHDLELSIQTYVYFLCHYASMMVFAYTFMMIIISFRPVLATWFWLQVVEFFDYMLSYNTPWFYILGVGVGITIIKFIVLSTTAIRHLKWSKT